MIIIKVLNIKQPETVLSLNPVWINSYKEVIFRNNSGIYVYANDKLDCLVKLSKKTKHMNLLIYDLRKKSTFNYACYYDNKVIFYNFDCETKQVTKLYELINYEIDFSMCVNEIKFLYNRYVLLNYVNIKKHVLFNMIVIDLFNKQEKYYNNIDFNLGRDYFNYTKYNNKYYIFVVEESMYSKEFLDLYNNRNDNTYEGIFDGIFILSLDDLMNGVFDKHYIDKGYDKCYTIISNIDDIMYIKYDVKANSTDIVEYDLPTNTFDIKTITRKDIDPTISYIYFHSDGEGYYNKLIGNNYHIQNLFHKEKDIVYPKEYGRCNQIIHNTYCIISNYKEDTDYLYNVDNKTFDKYENKHLYYDDNKDVLIVY